MRGIIMEEEDQIYTQNTLLYGRVDRLPFAGFSF
jgi:hypothetical protein